jgi:hypothetical protein
MVELIVWDRTHDLAFKHPTSRPWCRALVWAFLQIGFDYNVDCKCVPAMHVRDEHTSWLNR